MASGDGSDLQVHLKTAADGERRLEPRSSAGEVETGERKKQKVRAYSVRGTFWHHGVDCQTLLTGGASV